MKRREVLKGLGLSAGYVLSSPVVMSILQSCQNEGENISWAPEFFSKEEGEIVKNLVDLILPKTEAVPGAAEINVHKFIDVYLARVASKNKQGLYRSGLSEVLNELDKPLQKLKTRDYDALLSKFLKFKMVGPDTESKGKLVERILFDLRGMTVWVYKTSEEIGESILAYDPIPGVYRGCISLNETTGGKAWSL